MRLLETLFTVCALLAAVGCGRHETVPGYEMIDPVPAGWNMTPDEVVLAATAYCKSTGIDYVRKGPPVIVVDAYEGERLWYLGYHRNSEFPGDHFGILINDETQEIEFEGGE